MSLAGSSQMSAGCLLVLAFVFKLGEGLLPNSYDWGSSSTFYRIAMASGGLEVSGPHHFISSTLG